MKHEDTNLDYYGFSLLAYIQKEFNSKFKSSRDFFSHNDEKSDSFSYWKNFDLVATLFGDELTREGVAALGEAALAVGPGMVATLYSVSQWVPDRKRSALVMVNYRLRKEWLAVSIAEGVNSEDAESYLIKVDNRDCEELCLRFMDLVRERRLVS